MGLKNRRKRVSDRIWKGTLPSYKVSLLVVLSTHMRPSARFMLPPDWYVIQQRAVPYLSLIHI